MDTETPQLSRIEKLKIQKQQLEAKIQKEEARHKVRQRKEDTRRKVLLGAYLLDKVTKDGTFEAIKEELNTFLTREIDRALFDLPALDSQAS